MAMQGKFGALTKAVIGADTRGSQPGGPPPGGPFDTAGSPGDDPMIPNDITPEDAQIITEAGKTDPVIAAIGRALGLGADTTAAPALNAPGTTAPAPPPPGGGKSFGY